MNKRIVYLLIPVAIMMGMVGCGQAAPEAGGLVLEQHQLIASPQSDPFQFTPLESSMEEILQTHSEERNKFLTAQTTFMEGRTAIEATLDGLQLIAEQFYDNGGQDGYVTVTLDGTEIYRISTGPGSPVTSLAGLWVVDGSWWLETVLINLDGEPFATGQISRDGDLLNSSLNYQEAFGLQTIGGNPFYFFKRDGKVYYWYEDKETLLGYDQVTHYQCCSDSTLNPRASGNMVAFFASSGSDWYYVDLGLFAK